MQKVVKSLKSAYVWSRSLLCRIVVKLHFQLFNNVDIFSQWVAISQEDISKQKRLTGGMQRAGCRTVVFYQQNKGSVWLNFLNWSEPQKENNNYYDMALGALLWLAIPLKIIITMLWIKVILDMWVEFVVGSCRCSESFSPGPPVFLPPQEQTF